MPEATNVPRTLVLIDPSSPLGEGGLGALNDDDGAVTLLLTMSGRSAVALEEFAAAEEIDMSMAGLIYLDQVMRRLCIRTDDIEAISTSGSDSVTEILRVLTNQQVRRVIVPASLPGLDARAFARLLQMCPVQVVVAQRLSASNANLRIAS